jgi:BASS family bile acid:Na+ symporter
MCENIDSIVINFNKDSVVLLNICVSFIMFGIALDIKLSDFRRIFQTPRIPVIGLISEYLLLPLLTILLIYLFRPAPSFALGMILLATCPGGSTSNYMVHLSKGNTALSVTLTSITTLGAIVLTPLGFTLIAQLFPYTADILTTIDVSPLEMMKTILLIIALPVAVGMFAQARFPKFTARIRPIISTLSMVIFLGFVTVAIINNWGNLSGYVHCVFVVVTLHNSLALLMGFSFARIMGLTTRDARAVSIETGIQNTALGLAIAFQFFNGLGGMTMVLAWWGIWHLISGFGLALFWRRRFG